MAEEQVFQFKHYKDKKRIEEIKDLTKTKKKAYYSGEFKLFEKWCTKNLYKPDVHSIDKYLLHEVEEKKIRLGTLNRKVAALRFDFEEDKGITFTESLNETIQSLRQLYNFEPYLEKKGIEPFTYALQKEEAIQLIEQYKTEEKKDIRIYAISLVNLITANRPSEMVRLQIKDFDFKSQEVSVKLVKQKTVHKKRITLECVNAVKEYIEKFELSPDDYFVGRTNRWGQYDSVQINEETYRQNIHKWLKIAPYTLRKTQITSMYRKKADLATIARQSGHKSIQTITEHYIKLDSTDLDEFI
ncbi:tyrosine-type recombinase/integrase [Ureibacillus composti]|nr:tyrosine-type recombinase/integrase [Ureibacillus composti]